MITNSQIRRPLRLLAGLTIALAVGVVDYATGAEFGMSVFYGVLIFWLTGSDGLVGGVASASISLALWTVTQVFADAHYSHPFALYWNAGVRAVFFVTVVVLAKTRGRLHEARLANTTDFLSGLRNRRGFEEFAKHELDRAQRTKGCVTVVYIDCDNFKVVNDTQGHPVGNQLLRKVAAVLKATTRTVDVQARIGGDEFALLIAEAESHKAAEILDRIGTRLKSAMMKEAWPVTFSIGALTVRVSSAGVSIHDLLARADKLMYEAKNNGKDRTVHVVVD